MPTSYVVPALPIRRSVITLVLALVIITAMSIFFVREVIDLRHAMGQLRQNDTARIQVRNVLMNLLNAETGQRGFVLTGDPAYLEPYQLGRSSVRADLAQAEQSGYHDAAFLASVRKLALITESKLDELERTVQLKKRGDDAAALAIVREGFGRAKMREARQLIQEEVARLRVTRDALMDDFNDRLLRAAVILVLMLSTVVAMTVYAWRSLSAAARRNNELARRLAMEASHDALTGLPNRRFFDCWARSVVARSQRSGKPFTLLAIDLDRFKAVNDTHGHADGDEVLTEVARRFQSVLRGGEFLARIGGDEFVVLMEGEFSRNEVTSVGRRLIDCLYPSLHPRLADNVVGASIGAASFPLNGAGLEGVMQAADNALYASKHGGRGMLSFACAEVCPSRSVHGSTGHAAPAMSGGSPTTGAVF
ncbi:diguanylate cyclase domain-containing protein [Massilia sp. BSC265]|uniref:diguanylate cyclase domain-containing protein n=1 Tax=Massilia sp. BSC265 TaxID=1549812 RepID=UPI000689D7F9|nr:diguanylate cyclase [Massilia sp. BSC265]